MRPVITPPRESAKSIPFECLAIEQLEIAARLERPRLAVFERDETRPRHRNLVPSSAESGRFVSAVCIGRDLPRLGQRGRTNLHPRTCERVARVGGDDAPDDAPAAARRRRRRDRAVVAWSLRVDVGRAQLQLSTTISASRRNNPAADFIALT